MAIAIQGKFPILMKLVFEIRYQHGWTYLDRCGRAINLIRREFPQWLVINGPTPQIGSLLNVETACKFTFNSQKLDVSLEKPNRGEEISDAQVVHFLDAIETLTPIVAETLSLDEFIRIGCRVFFLFPAEGREDAGVWIKNLNFMSVSKSIESAFGGEIVYPQGGIVIAGDDRMFRLGFDVAEMTQTVDVGDAALNIPLSHFHKQPSQVGNNRNNRSDQLKKQQKAKRLIEQSPSYAAMVDIDSYQDFPELIKPREFAKETCENSLKYLRVACESKATTKA
jgi:hypothetical protein